MAKCESALKVHLKVLTQRVSSFTNDPSLMLRVIQH